MKFKVVETYEINRCYDCPLFNLGTIPVPDDWCNKGKFEPKEPWNEIDPRCPFRGDAYASTSFKNKRIEFYRRKEGEQG